MHSSTKYLGGHSDVVGGVLVTGDPELATKLRFARLGGGRDWTNGCLLELTGHQIPGIRMARHAETGMKLATMLEASKSRAMVYQD